GGHSAAAAFIKLRESHLSPAEYRVFPRCPLPLHELDQNAAPTIEPLINAYLRVGAYVCGEPAWDPDFNTADLLMLLPASRADARYAHNFIARHLKKITGKPRIAAAFRRDSRKVDPGLPSAVPAFAGARLFRRRVAPPGR